MKKSAIQKVAGRARSFIVRAAKSRKLLTVAVVGIIVLAGVVTLLFSRAATGAPMLSISPAAQTITTGTDIVITVTLDTAGASVNTAQSVVTYNPTNFTYVSMTPGPAFGAAFPNSATTGSIQFAAASTTPVTGVQTVATITLHALAAGSSTIQLAQVCGAGDYSSTCSAVYDSATSSNVLTSVINGDYTIAPVEEQITLSVPANLHTTSVAQKSISLAWDASTATGGSSVAGYKLYRNGALLATVSGTTYTDSRLTAGTTYSYTVAAYDNAGHASDQSSPLSATTTTRNGGGGGGGGHKPH